MSSDSSGLSDDVQARIHGEVDDLGIGVEDSTLPPIPDRPADGAPTAKWVDYCVALGADRAFLTEDTEHFDAEAGAVVTESKFARDDLIGLADRLGG